MWSMAFLPAKSPIAIRGGVPPLLPLTEKP